MINLKEKNTKEINEIKFKKKKKGIGKKILLIIIFILLAIGVIFGYKVYKNGGGTKDKDGEEDEKKYHHLTFKVLFLFRLVCHLKPQLIFHHEFLLQC